MNNFTEIDMRCRSVIRVSQHISLYSTTVTRIEDLKRAIERWEGEQVEKDYDTYLTHLMLTVLTAMNLGIEKRHKSLKARLIDLRNAIDEYLEKLDDRPTE